MEPLTDRDARLIAGDWHGGQRSPLYALASTGAILPNTLADIDSLRSDDSELAALRSYVVDHGVRGPQEGWIGR